MLAFGWSPRGLAPLLLVAVALLGLEGCATTQHAAYGVQPPQGWVPQEEYIPSEDVVEPGGADGHAPVGQGLTLMPYERFLPESDDPTRRASYWSYFQIVQPEAYSFAMRPDLWIPLQGVDYVPGQPNPGKWSPAGVITVAPKIDVGVLFHETFHTVFHRSALHEGLDRPWAEAWCDAFRFAAEREHMNPASPWAVKIAHYSEMTLEQILAERKDGPWLRKYAYPASLVVHRSGGTMDGLRKLWFELNQRKEQAGHDILDDYFGYSIREGRPVGPAA